MTRTKQTQSKRLLAIGDIHGHLNKLQSLMAQVNPTTKDQVVFLGDYVDRGPDSKGVIEYLIDFQKRFPKTVFLRGNHEQMLLDAMVEDRLYNGPYCANERKRLKDLSVSFARYTILDDDYGRFIDNGGQSTLDNYGGIICDIPKQHEDFLASCGFWHRETADIQVHGEEPKRQEFIFVHAGVCPGIVLEDQNIEDLLWIREPFLSHYHRYLGQTVPVTHSNSISELEAPVFKEHRIGLDGGANNQSFGSEVWGRIVCCDVLTHEYWEQA